MNWPLMVRRVQGHSMVPVLPPGTVVYGWRWFNRLKPENVVIFIRDRRETVKRIDHLDNDGVFVLGDHPETSTDSRHYGTVPRDAVEAIVIWPRTHKVMAEDLELSKTND